MEKSKTGLPRLYLEESQVHSMLIKLDGQVIHGIRDYTIKRTTCDPIIEVQLNLYCEIENILIDSENVNAKQKE